MGVHHRSYESYAFYELSSGKVDKVYVDGRAVINASSFRQNNPNYWFSQIHERSHKSLFSYPSVFDHLGAHQDKLSFGSNSVIPSEMKEEDLLLCSLTVLGFSLRDKRWHEYLSPVPA